MARKSNEKTDVRPSSYSQVTENAFIGKGCAQRQIS